MCKRVQRKDAVYGDWLGSWLSRYNLALKILQSKLYQQTSRFYQRRASKIFSLVASFYAAVYVTKEKAYFPPKNRSDGDNRWHVVLVAMMMMRIGGRL
ncbi:hypothetical protein Bca101_030291 [Brassica carinata]